MLPFRREVDTMTQRPLLIGQAPGPTGQPGERALSGRGGARLASIAEISLDEFLARVDTRNLLEEFPGRATRGDLFPLTVARERAEIVKAQEAEREVLIFVGMGVADAFDFDEPPCTWRRIAFPRRRLGMIPHPSGLNLWYNDETNVRQARIFLREILGLGGK